MSIVWMHRRPWCVICNLLLVYICYAVCRVAFIVENHGILQEAQGGLPLWDICKGALRYDSFAILVTNTPYILLALLPLARRVQKAVDAVARWIFVVVNTACIFVNLADVAYFPYSLERTNKTVFLQFEGNTNLLPIFAGEMITHWYLTLAFIVLILFLVFAYFKPETQQGNSLVRRISVSAASIIAMASLTSLAVYGSPIPKGEILSPNKAYWYTGAPIEVACVYNTPYTLMCGRIRHSQRNVKDFKNLAGAERYYSPVHTPADTTEFDARNIVIIIVESMSESFSGYNRHTMNRAKSCTPFVDSLARASLTYEHTFANGVVSIDALPSIISSLPRIGESYTVSANSLSTPPILARELKYHGYHSAFYHGGENTSMRFKAYTNQTGFDAYYGLDEYVMDSRFGGMDDYDGKWAVWDEEFLQYSCLKIGNQPEPFLSVAFTATSHHPYNIPKRYEAILASQEKNAIRRCMLYTDNALRMFFETAKKQPWYQNTIFVITADHVAARTHERRNSNGLDRMRVPILFFDPSGRLPRGIHPGVAQQIDIMPTLLGYLGHDREYIAFGQDLAHTPADQTWAYTYLYNPQYIDSDVVLTLDDATSVRMSKLKDSDNRRIRLDGDELTQFDQQIKLLKAMTYSCIFRMQHDMMTQNDLSLN